MWPYNKIAVYVIPTERKGQQCSTILYYTTTQQMPNPTNAKNFWCVQVKHTLLVTFWGFFYTVARVGSKPPLGFK